MAVRSVSGSPPRWTRAAAARTGTPPEPADANHHVLTDLAATVPQLRTDGLVTAEGARGVKMLLIAATSLLASVPALRSRASGRVSHRRVSWLGVALAATMTVSGVGYLLLNATLAPAAYLSGVLLLIWVTVTALTADPA